MGQTDESSERRGEQEVIKQRTYALPMDTDTREEKA